MDSKPPDQISDKEAERRATDALRRALSAPYKPQSKMKIGRKKTHHCETQKIKVTTDV